MTSLTSSKLVMTAGLLLESAKLDTGVLSASLAALEAAATAVVGVVKETDVATVVVLVPAVTVEVAVDETDVATMLALEAAVTVVVGVNEMEVLEVTDAVDDTVVVIDVDITVLVLDAKVVVGIFLRMSSLAFHPSCKARKTVVITIRTTMLPVFDHRLSIKRKQPLQKQGGSVVQWLARRTHNLSVPGSSLALTWTCFPVATSSNPRLWL